MTIIIARANSIDSDVRDKRTPTAQDVCHVPYIGVLNATLKD